MHALAIPLGLAFLLIFWRVSRGQKPGIQLHAATLLVSLIAVFVSVPALWQALYEGYPKDSFFTLKTSGRLGVLAISSTAIMVFFQILTQKTGYLLHWSDRRDASTLTRLCIFIGDCVSGIALFIAGIWVLPQAFYGFYRILIPNLPQQIVIKPSPDFERLADILQLQSDGSLSQHLTGITFYAVILFTAFLHGYNKSLEKQSIVLLLMAYIAIQIANII
ncbi:MAG: hypothetical protein H2045_05125 [Rhizobiales bacterium]|nr:hypothetical protein [Hyphomicrobiales bacterium]